jgi:hypothetical protein
MSFSGSYAPQDVTFLLKPVAAADVGPNAGDLAAKEALIQSGARHYSEMLTHEVAPDPRYLAIFETALARHADRMGREVASLARGLDAAIDGPITLASFVRAGVPLGVLLVRALKALGRDAVHFGISIIRDRGLDMVALDAIRAMRPEAGLVFVDGWTGKGAITQEMEDDLAARAPGIAPRLVVLADPGGRAWMAAGHDDWLIPSGILGANVSGLISRSVLNARVVGPGEYHAAVVTEHLRAVDLSRRFVDEIHACTLRHLADAPPARPDPPQRAATRARAEAAIDALAQRHGVRNRNRIKPGIAEATRAVLRRAPERVMLRGGDDPDLAGLIHLAREAGVTLEIAGDALGPYRAVTLLAHIEGRDDAGARRAL